MADVALVASRPRSKVDGSFPTGLENQSGNWKTFAHLAFFNLTDRPWPISSSITSASAFSAAK